MKPGLLSFCLFSVWLTASFNPLKAQDEKFKAIFIYNFTKYINWPPGKGDFVIYVLGDDIIINELTNIAMKKTVGDAKITIKKTHALSDISDCKIIYIAGGKTDLLGDVFLIAKKNNILVITDKVNSCKNGACINFLSKDGRLTFEVSKPNIELCGLEVSSSLLNLGQMAGN